MAARVSKSDRGFTLVEVLVSLVIVFIVFVGIGLTGLFTLEQNIVNEARDEAVRIAQMETSQARAIPFSALDAWGAAGTTYDVRIRGLTVRYTVARSVVVLNATNRQVAVTVTWPRNGRGGAAATHQVTTVVRSRG